MNPQQPDYSFIMQGGDKNKTKFSAPKTQKQRILTVIFLGVTVLLLATVSIILFSSLGVDNTQKLTDLAKQQTELQRIMELGAKDSNNSKVKIFAQTASLTYGTHKQNILSTAIKKKVVVDEKKLSLGKSIEIDKQLDNAKSANTYDDVFIDIYESELLKYNKKIKELYDQEDDKDLKLLFSDFYKNTLLMSTNYKPAAN